VVRHCLLAARSLQCTRGEAAAAATSAAPGAAAEAAEAAEVANASMLVQEFAPPGGHYKLCWCANMHGVQCTLKQNFLLDMGNITVEGPTAGATMVVARGQALLVEFPLHGAMVSWPLLRQTPRHTAELHGATYRDIDFAVGAVPISFR
jgi:hypothetical protein